jgi:hypothetical protein
MQQTKRYLYLTFPRKISEKQVTVNFLHILKSFSFPTVSFGSILPSVSLDFGFYFQVLSHSRIYSTFSLSSFRSLSTFNFSNLLSYSTFGPILLLVFLTRTYSAFIFLTFCPVLVPSIPFYPRSSYLQSF